ncbi:MAG TPA: ABC transporter substrate-binding protein [Methylomirabilota bacterium]|nr:ABC transporter substrate-binding protein [Methylomirabilota bacterium]
MGQMTRRSFLATTSLAAAGTAAGPWVPGAHAQAKSITIGVLYDLTGPFAAAGAVPGSIGTKIAFDMINEKGGVLGKHKIRAIEGDSQSKPDVAINEAERLLNVEKVDILLGIYSSAIAVPLAEKVDKQNRVLWVTIAIDDRVFRGRDLKYTFRAQPPGSQFGQLSARFIADYAPERFKMKPQEVKGAIIYEDGPYGSGVAASGEAELKKIGMKLVLKEGYSASAPDLASLVTKLKAARPDVLFHTGYNPDINLFLRQSKEQGLRVRAYIGHGAGHSQLDKLKEAFGRDIEWFHTVDPIAAQLIDPKKLRPGVGDMTAEMVKRFQAEFDRNMPVDAIAPHVSMGFNNVWLLLTDVVPRAIQKHGGFGPEALAAAARETDIPEGGTMQGYGVRFYPAGHRFAGQNERAYPAVFQVVEGKFVLVYPKVAATAQPVLPFPSTSPFAAR